MHLRKNKKTKAIALPSAISCLFGVTEAAIFGVNMKYGRPFIGAAIGGALGGAYIVFSKVVFTFKCNYSTKVNDIDIYPFGIKHILFKEADFLLDSFAIVELRSNQLIDYIYNDIVLYSVNGKIETTMDMYDVEVYTDYTKVLTGRVYPSTNAQANRIAKNTKVLYLKVPLIKQNKANDEKEYLSLTGIKVNMTTQEEIII